MELGVGVGVGFEKGSWNWKRELEKNILRTFVKMGKVYGVKHVLSQKSKKCA